MSRLYVPPYQNAIDLNGDPIPGGQLRFYQAGTLTPLPVYTTSALTTAHASPVVADSAGRYPAIYLDPDLEYRVRESDAGGVLIRDTDPLSYGSIAGNQVVFANGASVRAPAANQLVIGTTDTNQRMFFDAAGSVTVHGPRGSTGAGQGSGSLRVIAPAAGGICGTTYDTQDYTAWQFIRDISGTPTQMGFIGVSNVTVTYGVGSDQRLKENFRPFDSGALVDALSFGEFDWKVGGVGHGVIAQQAHDVFPEAVIPGDGERPWMVDYSKFVAVAMAELKALRSRVAALEAVK